MGQYVFLSPNANKKLRAILQGTFLHRLFRFSSFDQLSLLSQSFHSSQAVYIRFSHITNFQPKFYIGSTSSTVLDREHTRFRKFLQVQQQKLVLAEVALRFWHRFDNFWMWSILPLFTNNSNFWALEQALIQVWQPRLNTPFIYQFFNCKKGLIAQRPFCSSHQFGTFSLWRKLRWTSTPKRIRATLYSKKFHDRTALWEVIQHLGTNSLKRFQMEKRIRSNEFGLHGCYFIRKLAANLGEPQRSYALNAIDRAIQFWKGKRVPRCLPLRAPWILSPTWSSDLRKVLRQHCAQMRPHTMTFQSPSSAVVFTKNPSVQDSLCNHKDYATRWADGENPVCICSTLTPYQSSPTSNSTHIHLDGDSLTLPTPSLSAIANGSLQNKIFPSKKEIWTNLQKAFVQWHQRNGIPAIPTRHLEDLWNTSWSQHRQQLHNHISHYDITQFTKLFPGAVFHNEDKRATSLRIYCPVLYFECLMNTFSDDNVFKRLKISPDSVIQTTLLKLQRRFKKQYPWALGKGRTLPNAYVLPKRKKQFLSGRPIVSFFAAPFRPMLNCIAKLLYQVMPAAFPHNLAKGDVFELIQLLKQGDFDSQPTPQLHNQDLAGFFTSIDTDRFVTSWRLTLHFLSSTMNTQPDELFSVKPSVGNQPGDVVKGRTCRTLNVTRKIYIRDIEPVILASLEMTQFSIGTAVFQQIRGSPMGSPLSPALCLMVVALSEEVWFRTYESQLTNMDLTSRLLRYVDNRLCLPDPNWIDDPAFKLFLHPDFYGNPIILETEPDQEFLGFILEFDPFTMRYSPPRDLNQVMAPFSASPLNVQLSGFVSRMFLVAKCAHPSSEQFRGFAALHRLYRQAGFRDEDLITAARPISKYMHTNQLW